MKNIIILAFALGALNSFAAELNCAKSGSKLTLNKKEVVIEANNIAITDELREMARNSIGASAEDLSLSMTISFPGKDLKCSDTAGLVHCSGKTKKAAVTIKAIQRSGFGAWETETMRRPVKIENIDIQTSLSSDGPIVLGGSSTTVALSKLNAKSSMFVKMNGDFQLDLEQSFAQSTECK